MNTMTFEDFAAGAKAKGADEALERVYGPNLSIPEHSHPFDADAVVTQGDMWLTCGDDTRHLFPGDTFQLTNGTLHAERYGPDGAIYWVARRNAR